MIMTVEELRRYIETEEDDLLLEGRLQAVEHLIRAYTHNDFSKRGFTCIADVVGGTFTAEKPVDFEMGDTIQIIKSDKNDGLYTVKSINGNTFTVNERTRDEIDVYVSMVEYPMDVKMGVLTMIKWELTAREKSWVQSETISRHTINYLNLDAWNSEMSYPKSLLGFLKPYKKARFGGGLHA